MDPVSGDIKLRYIDFKSLIIDPFFRKSDLSDCRFIMTRQFFDRQEASFLYPDFADKIMELPRGKDTDKFYYMPENQQVQFPDLIAFDEYWYLSTRKAKYLLDRETNEMQEFDGDEDVMKYNEFMYPGRFKVVKKNRQTTRRAILVNNKVLVDEQNPYGIDRYPFVASLGYFTPDTPYYQYKFKGIVRDARDAQYLFNRRKVADLDILEAQQQGLKVKKGALVTPKDALNSGNGRVLTIDPKYSLDDVQPMPIIPPDPTMLQMEEMLSSLVMRITGANEELMGAAVDDKAGVLAMLRQGAGLVTLQRLFDQMDETQKQVGDIMIEMVQKNWTYSKVRDVLGEEPTPEFDHKAFAKYSTKIVQGVLTETQQQLEYAQLLDLYERTGGTQPILLQRAIEVAPIQEKDKILEAIEQQNQAAQQMQQQEMQMQQQQMQVDMETKLAYAESQHGLAAERMAKIQTDRAVAEDKLSRAEQEDTASLLNLVKTIKELQSIDTQNLLAQ
jgi:hypothetical protein